ncbi:hypothetical protein ACFX2K_034479 [Malus domestica]
MDSVAGAPTPSSRKNPASHFLHRPGSLPRKNLSSLGRNCSQEPSITFCFSSVARGFRLARTRLMTKRKLVVAAEVSHKK